MRIATGQEYQQVLWASAETEELLTSAYTQIATKLDLPEKEAKDKKIVVEAVNSGCKSTSSGS